MSEVSKDICISLKLEIFQFLLNIQFLKINGNNFMTVEWIESIMIIIILTFNIV